MLKSVILSGKAVVTLVERQLDQDVMEDPAQMLLFERTTRFV